MTDKEMLELAAKAAGYTSVGLTDDGTALLLYGIQKPWNPRDENPHSDCMGDALRLVVKLRIDLSLWMYPNSVEAKTHIGAGRGISLTSDNARPTNSHREGNGTDPYAATRRAITRAAAEIGKGMK